MKKWIKYKIFSKGKIVNTKLWLNSKLINENKGTANFMPKIKRQKYSLVFKYFDSLYKKMTKVHSNSSK